MTFRWKSTTQIMKVVDTNHLNMSRCLWQSVWQVCDKLIWVAVMEFSPFQCTGKVGNKVHDKVCRLYRGHKSRKSTTQIMKIGGMICITDFHDLCPRQIRGLCCKVDIMEFGLYYALDTGTWASMAEETSEHLVTGDISQIGPLRVGRVLWSKIVILDCFKKLTKRYILTVGTNWLS